jgi:hypothetical protein
VVLWRWQVGLQTNSHKWGTPPVRPLAQETKFKNKLSSFSLFSSEIPGSPACRFVFHIFCALGNHMENSIIYPKYLRWIPFYLKKAAQKTGRKYSIPDSTFWLYCTAWVIFSGFF